MIFLINLHWTQKCSNFVWFDNRKDPIVWYNSTFAAIVEFENRDLNIADAGISARNLDIKKESMIFSGLQIGNRRESS